MTDTWLNTFHNLFHSVLTWLWSWPYHAAIMTLVHKCVCNFFFYIDSDLALNPYPILVNCISVIILVPALSTELHTNPGDLHGAHINSEDPHFQATRFCLPPLCCLKSLAFQSWVGHWSLSGGCEPHWGAHPLSRLFLCHSLSHNLCRNLLISISGGILYLVPLSDKTITQSF